MRFVTDLRGLTRPAVSLALRADLRLTGEARDRGIGACGHGGSWAIMTGTPPPTPPPKQQGGRQRQQPPPAHGKPRAVQDKSARSLREGSRESAPLAAQAAVPVTTTTAVDSLNPSESSESL